MIKSIFKLSTIQVGLLLILMPFVFAFLDGMISLISILSNFTSEIPLFEIAIYSLHIFFLIWIWSVCVTINARTLKIKNKLFKICFFIYLSFRFFDFLFSLNFEIFKKDWPLENEIIYLVEFIALFYGTTALISYIYMSVFTGKIISKMSINKPSSFIDKFPKFFFIMAFPVGITLFQSRIQDFLKENQLFGLENSSNRRRNDFQQKPQGKVEDKVIVKNEVIDKEDPTRFMPK